jgi:hypothetical protein
VIWEWGCLKVYDLFCRSNMKKHNTDFPCLTWSKCCHLPSMSEWESCDVRSHRKIKTIQISMLWTRTRILWWK